MLNSRYLVYLEEAAPRWRSGGEDSVNGAKKKKSNAKGTDDTMVGTSSSSSSSATKKRAYARMY